ncbi:hypothetical protein SteCoe_38378 [Stentor coeruleus]|uniref:Uncharacterized protein n=1 Tax=Stentor coeruleus TaxID=5963 RepID=A0A1R2ALJ9_9CILI|nr:hypothetical protein SteCoe_38378 [Stentor coeruleus]
MSFTCRSPDCMLWAESECSCQEKFRYCGYHMLNLHKESVCGTKSLKRELYESLSKVKETEKILEQLKADLISTADNMIASILQIVYEGVNQIERKKDDVSKWMRENEDKNIEDILGQFKFLRIKERSTESFTKYIRKLLSLNQQSKIELICEVNFLKDKSNAFQTESEKSKNEYVELATKIREGNYSLVDYEKQLNEVRIFNIELETKLKDKEKEFKDLSDKIDAEREQKCRQDELKNKLDKDQEERRKKEKIERQAQKTAARKLEIDEIQKKEITARNEQKRLIDESITLKKGLEDQKKVAQEEKKMYEEMVKKLEALGQENSLRIKELEKSLKNCNDECATLRQVKEERDKKVEEKRRKKEEEEKRKRDEEEEIIRKQVEEKKRLDEEERERKMKEEKKKRDEEEKKKIEEERIKKEAEERKKQEEEGRKKIQEEDKKRDEEEKKIQGNQGAGMIYL